MKNKKTIKTNLECPYWDCRYQGLIAEIYEDKNLVFLRCPMCGVNFEPMSLKDLKKIYPFKYELVCQKESLS